MKRLISLLYVCRYGEIIMSYAVRCLLGFHWIPEKRSPGPEPGDFQTEIDIRSIKKGLSVNRWY